MDSADNTIAIIGAGFAGIGMAIRLKTAGIHNFTIYERAPRVGGVWRDNHYPGVACDVESHLYSYAFEPWPDQTEGQQDPARTTARRGVPVDGTARLFGRRRDDLQLHGADRAVAGMVPRFDQQLESSRRNPQLFDAIGSDLVHALEQRRSVGAEQRDVDLRHAPTNILHAQREL